MATKMQERQAFIRYYKKETGKQEVVMKEVAHFAAKMGWTLPVPADPVDLLAKQFSEAAREEIRHDKKTKRPYKVNHPITVTQGNAQLTFWIDLDEAPRHKAVKALMQYRDQMVGEAVWSRIAQITGTVSIPVRNRFRFR